MVKQKIMYLLCLLMFAVGINAQFTPGTVDYGRSSNVGSRSAKGVTQSATYDATTGEVVYTFEVTGHDLIRTGRDGQGVTITDTNLNVTSVTVKVGSTTMNAVKSANSGQPDRSGERAQVWIAKPASGKIVGSSTITVRVKPASAGEAVRISGLYTWQADDNILSTAAGHFNEASAPITNTYNYLGIGGPNGITYQTPVPDSVKPSITASDIIVYRGETYNTTITARDDKGMKSIVANNAPEGGTFTPSVSGTTGTLTLSGTVALNRGRTSPNVDTNSSHTITATDNANNTASATLRVTIKPQTAAYDAKPKAVQTFARGANAPTAASLVDISKIASSLDNIPQGATYAFTDGVQPNMNQVGDQDLPILITYADGSTDKVTAKIRITDNQAPTVESKEVVVYRGETYNIAITARDNVSVTTLTTNSHPAGSTSTVSAVGANRTITFGGTVPLDPNRVGDKNTRASATTHTITASDANNNSGTGTLKVTIAPQTEVYKPTAKPAITVNKGTAVTPQELIQSIAKEVTASTLPTAPRNPRYTWESAGDTISTTTAGRKIGKVRVTYEDNSYDVVDVEVIVPETAPVAMGSEFTVYRGEDYSLVNNGQPFVTATHSDQNITAFAPKGANPPSTVVTAGVSNFSIRSDVPKNPGYLRGRAGVIVPLNSALGTATYVYTARIGEVSLGNTIHSNEANVIIHTKAQTEAYTASEKAGIRKTLDLNSTAPAPGTLVSVVKDVSTLPNTPRNATYTYVTAPKMDQVGAQTVRVKVTYEDGSDDEVDIDITIVNRKPIIEVPGRILVWRNQSVQNPVKTRAYDRDGTIVSLRTTLTNWGFTVTYENEQITVAGTPTHVGNGTVYVFVTDDKDATESRIFSFDIIDAEGGIVFKNINETASEQEVLDKVKITYSGLNPQLTRVILDRIPTYQEIKNGASNKVRVQLTTVTNEVKIVDVFIEYPPICTKPANTTGTALNTIVGITNLGRAEGNGNLNDDTSWPMMRKGGWLALESNDKGFVVTRMTTTQITAISAPQEGMIVYDTDAKCLKLYDGTKWSCFSQPVCPKF